MTTETQAPEGAPDLRAAAQTALDALENNTGEYRVTGAASTLRAALAAQPQQARAYREANPLGGPAKVFRAMADAIEAGDSYEDTLRRFEYAEARPSPAEGDSELPRMLREIGYWDHRGDEVSEACDERYGAGSWAAILAMMESKAQPKGTVSEFTNELGNAIRITIEGPTSTSDNVLTPMEAAKLRGALNEHAAQAPAPAPELADQRQAFYAWKKQQDDGYTDFQAWSAGVSHGRLRAQLASPYPTQAPAVGADVERDAARWRTASTSKNFGIVSWTEFGMRVQYGAAAAQTIDAAISAQPPVQPTGAAE